MFPAYIPPKEDELFSSWLMRLSKNHLYKSHSFSRFYFKGTEIWNRDVDVLMPENIIQSLISNTFLTLEEIKSMFLIDLVGKKINVLRSNAPNKEILQLGINHRKRKHYGLLYCPGCLDSDDPYFKKEWRLAYSLICLKCGLYLNDRCLYCNSPIVFHRLEIGYKSKILNHKLSICSNCFKSLCSFKLRCYDHSVIRFQEDLIKAEFNIIYLKKIKLYISLMSILNFKNNNKFKVSFEENFKINLDNSCFTNINTRVKVFPLIHDLFNDREKINSFLLKHNLSYSYFDNLSSSNENLFSIIENQII